MPGRKSNWSGRCVMPARSRFRARTRGRRGAGRRRNREPPGGVVRATIAPVGGAVQPGGPVPRRAGRFRYTEPGRRAGRADNQETSTVAPIAIVFGILLTVQGLVAYLTGDVNPETGHVSYTSLIPAGAGVLLLLFGLVA